MNNSQLLSSIAVAGDETHGLLLFPSCASWIVAAVSNEGVDTLGRYGQSEEVAGRIAAFLS